MASRCVAGRDAYRHESQLHGHNSGSLQQLWQLRSRFGGAGNMGRHEAKSCACRLHGLNSGVNRFCGICTLLMLFSSNVQAVWFGRMDSRMQAGEGESGVHGFIEQQANLRYQADDQGLAAAISVTLRQDDDLDAGLYSLWLKKKLSGIFDEMRLGRLPRADGLGLYTLDGVSLSTRKTEEEVLSWLFYVGKPVRSDDLSTQVAHRLLGAELNYSVSDLDAFAYLRGKLEWQRLEDNGWQNHVGWSLAAEHSFDAGLAQSWVMDFFGHCAMNGNGCDDIMFSNDFNLSQHRQLHLSYKSWNAGNDSQGFKQHFYARFAQGRQHQLTAEYSFKTRYNRQWLWHVQNLWREQGETGYGFALELTQREESGQLQIARVENIVLADDHQISAFYDLKKFISSTTKVRTGVAMQLYRNALHGTGRLSGIDFSVEQRMYRSTYLSMSCARWWDSQNADEYRFALELSYHFDAGRS